MENKKILEGFIRSQNSMAKEEDKIKLIISENEIVVDFGYSIFRQWGSSSVTDEDYRRIWSVITNAMLLEFRKNKKHDKV